MNEELEYILRVMCDYVDADYDNIDFKRPRWYTAHTWTSKNEKRFIDWLTLYLYHEPDARQILMRYPRKKMADCKQVAGLFVFSFGWTVVDG